MDGWRAQDRRDFWLPGLVGLIGVLISLAVWGLLIADRRAQILASAVATASETRETIRSELEDQEESLLGLQQLWREFGLRPEAEWRANVDQRVDRVPGLRAVAWIDLDQPRKRIAVGRETPVEEFALDLEEARRHYDGGAFLAGPEFDATGAAHYRVFLPLRTSSDAAGVLVARFDVIPTLETVLRARAPGYALSVHWGDREIFVRGAPAVDPWQRWWRSEETVELPIRGEWRIVLRPTPELAAARLTPIPHYLLAAGLLLSAVLAVSAHQFRVIVQQSRFREASNRALEQRGLELEARVADRTRALEEAVAESEAFNYSVSHDLRSPLGAILNFTAILEEDYRGRVLDSAGVAMLARIRRSAARATELLEDLLQLSRAGRAALTLESVDMTVLARETLAQVRAAESDADVDVQIGPLPPAIVDRALLGTVFANLFSNAFKYSRGREKRRVAVSGHGVDGENVYEVVDNGCGFDMRFADKLFGLFERLHTEEDIDGTGVGLAMVARIVKRHGGRVWAEGRPGEGATFGFALPRREAR